MYVYISISLDLYICISMYLCIDEENDTYICMHTYICIYMQTERNPVTHALFDLAPAGRALYIYRYV